MKPTAVPTCTKCGAQLPDIGDSAFRCAYCGTEYRAAHVPSSALDSEAIARMLAERMVAHREARAKRRSGCVVGLGLLVFAAVIGATVAVWLLKSGPLGPSWGDDSGASLLLSGSNTIGADLAPSLAEQFLRSRSAAGVSRTSSGKRVTVSGTLGSDPSPTSIAIDAQGTGTAFTALAAGKCDIAMASRPISPNERSALPAPPREAVIGLDGIAVIVHPSVLLEKIDTDQLSRVFSGEVNNWLQLGAGAGPITVYARDANSGTWDTFRGLVLPSSALREDAQRFDSNDALVAAVSRTPGSIGFTSLTAARGAKVLAVGEPGAQPIVPGDFTVATETYPLTRRLYFYTTKASMLGDQLIAFAQSPEGQAIVQRTGFVDLRPRSEPELPRDCTGCTPEYKRATTSATRMSVDFRFESGSSVLDSRGQRDVDRVAVYAKEQHARKVVLLGFADSQGSPQVNASVSLDRARAVQKSLRDKGTDSDAEGFADSMPVASNSTPEGREKNRRVEVWMVK